MMTSLLTPLTVPFVITMVIVLMISTWMLFGPAEWLYKLMELTPMSLEFKGFLLALAVGGFAVSYSSEKFLFPSFAKWVGRVKVLLSPQSKKKRKEYKVIAEGMAIA